MDYYNNDNNYQYSAHFKLITIIITKINSQLGDS